MTEPARPRVVIVGAGFAGLAAAKELADAPVDVTLVDRHNFHTFVQATVVGADLPSGQLMVDGGPHHVGDLSFDHLVLAAGATTNTFGIPGVAEHGFPLYKLSDAVSLRNHILERFEASDADQGLIEDGSLTFVVVGGGPTGVEVAGALSELFSMVLRRSLRSAHPRAVTLAKRSSSAGSRFALGNRWTGWNRIE